MIELYLFLVFMIIAAIIAIEIKDLLAAAIAVGAVGFSVAILFIILQAPDLAIVQIVVEILTLIIFVAVIFRTTDVDETIGKGFKPMQIFGLVFFGFFVILFLIVMERIFSSLPPFGSPMMKVASEYIKMGLPKVGGANIVADIILDFRGLDTLGEATVLFTSVIGVLVVMRKIGKKAKEGVIMTGMSLIVRRITNIVSGFIFMYGIYIILHGHLTPGGGFAGGVILSGALILRVLSFGSGADKEKRLSTIGSVFESIGALLFWGAAFTGLLVAGVFFLNEPIFGLGKPFHLLSAGLIPICNIAIGIKVSVGLLSMFLALAAAKYIMED